MLGWLDFDLAHGQGWSFDNHYLTTLMLGTTHDTLYVFLSVQIKVTAEVIAFFYVASIIIIFVDI